MKAAHTTLSTISNTPLSTLKYTHKMRETQGNLWANARSKWTSTCQVFIIWKSSWDDELRSRKWVKFIEPFSVQWFDIIVGANQNTYYVDEYTLFYIKLWFSQVSLPSYHNTLVLNRTGLGFTPTLTTFRRIWNHLKAHNGCRKMAFREFIISHKSPQNSLRSSTCYFFQNTWVLM